MLASCVTQSNADVDTVVKLNGSMDGGTRSAVFELVGSLMADRLGIATPSPFLVSLSREFIDAVAAHEPADAQRLGKSVGCNFGSKMMKDAVIWPEDAPIPKTMLTDAVKIFMLDGLTQNADRRRGNPNLMTEGDKLVVFDHECAFSFLDSFLPSSEPWTMGAGDYMERHALCKGLKGTVLDWAACRESLQGYTDAFFDSVRQSIPDEWHGLQYIEAIQRHVKIVVQHSDLFEIELQRRIA
jgi:hypothetical protein